MAPGERSIVSLYHVLTKEAKAALDRLNTNRFQHAAAGLEVFLDSYMNITRRFMKTVIQILHAKGEDVYTVVPQVSVFDALKLMAEYNIGALVVVEEGKVVGIFTERDYARKMILKDRSSRDTPVRKVMTERVITVDPATTIEVCMDLMTFRHIRHLPVIENNRLIGIVSIGDIMKAILVNHVHPTEYQENRVIA